MEKFKIVHFEKENPGENFPFFIHLSNEEARGLFEKLQNKIGGSLTPQELSLEIRERSSYLVGENAEKDDFSVKRVVSRIGVKIRRYIYINWYLFDNIDKMDFSDFNQFFDDIWYPGADDVDIFDNTTDWLVSINHDGSIKYLFL